MTAPALDRMQRRADPLADDTVAAVLGEWGATTFDERLRRIGTLNRLVGEWQTNGQLEGWRATGSDVTEGIASAVESFVRHARVLPAWADAQQIARAEQIFFDQGPLSCLLLFCTSLPECYVIPDLAAVLHVAGQLERHTDYRVRSTAAMIFPVMMHGGLTTPEGSGVAQVLKVRLIHATIRNLILHGDPAKATGVVAGLPASAAPSTMHGALASVGWDVRGRGLPCNQEELAYTLLTFSRCFLQGMRRLHLRLPDADETACLHTWNVVGHILGIERELMTATMAGADALFDAMQRRGRAEPRDPDARPALAAALMNAMAAVIPWRVARPMPVLMTRHLCGARTSDDLGLDQHVSWLSRALFAVGMSAVRLIDGAVRLVVPQFSLARFVSRILGYHLITGLLMDQTRPLQLPERVLNQVDATVGTWGEDPRAPAWLNVMEDRYTTIGRWSRRAGP